MKNHEIFIFSVRAYFCCSVVFCVRRNHPFVLTVSPHFDNLENLQKFREVAWYVNSQKCFIWDFLYPACCWYPAKIQNKSRLLLKDDLYKQTFSFQCSFCKETIPVNPNHRNVDKLSNILKCCKHHVAQKWGWDFARRACWSNSI